MTKQKSNRVFLGIVTICLAFAGTGLTIANNWENDFQVATLAIMLAACFTSAEVTFLWGHKRFEDANKLWRKVTLGITLGIVGLAMSFAVYEEFKLAMSKTSNRSLASNFKEIVSGSSEKTQGRTARHAINKMAEGKIQIEHLPFVICYGVTILASIAILAASERKRQRTTTYGNQLPLNPILQKHIQQIGFNPETAKAYRDNRERGFAIHADGQYRKFVSDTELSKYS